MLLLLGLGLYPQPVLDISAASMQTVEFIYNNTPAALSLSGVTP